MSSILEQSQEFAETALKSGDVLLAEGEKSGRLVVLVEGAIEVHRDGVTIAIVTDPGSVFGEMSILLDIPHTAEVRAATDAKVRIIDNAAEHMEKNPALVLPIARLLARRLQNSTTYLVDLKKQFQDKKDHFAMVDQVLESLSHEQGEEFSPDDDLPAEP